MEKNNNIEELRSITKKAVFPWKGLVIILGAILVFGYVFDVKINFRWNASKSGEQNIVNQLPEEQVSVSVLEDVSLPINWSNFGKQMVDTGVIDAEKLEAIYLERGKILSAEEKNLLYGENNREILMTKENSAYLLNLLWAFGLANKNPILEDGPMTDLEYGGAGNFASTGGWTIAQGDAMEHYSRHAFAVLTPEQQDMVERVSKNIYRPCCGNSTYFPDCNHGMAMLGLLELMAVNGVSENEMYKVALRVNALWFPDQYETIAKFLASNGIDWNKADPKEILGFEFSSGQGYSQIVSRISPVEKRSGGGCGV
jgi:hypothetical protein